MIVQFVLFLLILFLKNSSSYADEITLENITANISMEVQDFRIFTCGEIINVSVFECLPVGQHPEVNALSCMENKTSSFDEEICYTTTVYPTELNTQTTVYPIELTTKKRVSPPLTCENGNFGTSCNISSDPCVMAKLCQNEGTCYSNDTFQLGYYCKCPPGYSGTDCQDENGNCKHNTCWHNGECVDRHETVSVDNTTTFHCTCPSGYDGSNCQLISNMCINITCQNRGRCISQHLSWSCECLGSLYFGTYCEETSNEIKIKQVLSKSFASIAIVAIVLVYLFVIIMDILKFVFGIDPIHSERELMELQQKKKKELNRKNKKKKIKKVHVKHFHFT